MHYYLDVIADRLRISAEVAQIVAADVNHREVHAVEVHCSNSSGKSSSVKTAKTECA